MTCGTIFGNQLAMGGLGPALSLLSFEPPAVPAVVSSIPCVNGYLWTSTLSPDGRWLAIGGSDGGVRIFATPALTPAASLGETDVQVYAIAFAPSSRSFVASFGDHLVLGSCTEGDQWRIAKTWHAPTPGTLFTGVDALRDDVTWIIGAVDGRMFTWAPAAQEEPALLMRSSVSVRYFCLFRSVSSHHDSFSQVTTVRCNPRVDQFAVGMRGGFIEVFEPKGLAEENV